MIVYKLKKYDKDFAYVTHNSDTENLIVNMITATLVSISDEYRKIEGILDPSTGKYSERMVKAITPEKQDRNIDDIIAMLSLRKPFNSKINEVIGFIEYLEKKTNNKLDLIEEIRVISSLDMYHNDNIKIEPIKLTPRTAGITRTESPWATVPSVGRSSLWKNH